MDNHDEISQLLAVVEKAGDHGTQFASIRESAVRRLKAIEAETAKTLAEEKKVEAQKLEAEKARLTAAREAEVKRRAAENEAELAKEDAARRKTEAQIKAERETPVKVETHASGTDAEHDTAADANARREMAQRSAPTVDRRL